jgi:predicted transcriptional regulator
MDKMKKYKVSLKIADTSEPEVRIFDTQDEATDWAGAVILGKIDIIQEHEGRKLSVAEFNQVFDSLMESMVLSELTVAYLQ